MPKEPRFTEPAERTGTVAELFAGVGGFRLGLAAAGFKTVFSNQWEPSTRVQHASDVYKMNFGPEGHTNVDIAKVKTIPDVDLLVGGFPCQDYSVAKALNSSKGLEGKKGVLWWEILRLVKKKKPRYVFLENVDRLLKSPSTQRGRDFAIMLKTLGEHGYLVEWRVVSASDYGFPQRRIRVFIVAKRTTLEPADPKKVVTEDGILARALPVNPVAEQASIIDLSDSAELISRDFNKKKLSKSPFLNSGVYFANKAYTYKTSPKFEGKKEVLGDILLDESEVPREFFVHRDKISDWKYQKGAKTILRVHKGSGSTYTYAEGKMAFPDSLSQPSRTILTGEGGASPSRFKHIIKTRKGYRRLTPVELERLSGFPDNWTAEGINGLRLSDAKRAFLIGNALVVGLVTRVGAVIARDLRAKVGT
jgi:DNA (cytosine-5)-methyltransferase 1